MKLVCKFCGKEYEYDGSLPKSWGVKGSLFSKLKFCCYECGSNYKKEKLSNYHKDKIKENFNYWKERYEKTKQTNLNKYGHENVGQFGSLENKKAIISKYNIDNVAKVKEIHDKITKTSKEKWKNNFNNREKAVNTSLKKYGKNNYNNKQKSKQTCLNKYGVEYSLQLPEIRQKIKNTNLKKYGNEIYSKSIYFKQNKDIIIQKQFNTKKANNSFNTSKPEEEIYKLLIEKYPNIQYQYKSEKYPFECDFYIPELDLYIEYQGFWHHGKEPYDKNNEEHIKLIEKWKKLKNKQYKQAIITWTISDPLKRKIAKENSLNWIEFFNMKEFFEWYNKL